MNFNVNQNADYLISDLIKQLQAIQAANNSNQLKMPLAVRTALSFTHQLLCNKKTPLLLELEEFPSDRKGAHLNDYGIPVNQIKSGVDFYLNAITAMNANTNDSE